MAYVYDGKEKHIMARGKMIMVIKKIIMRRNNGESRQRRKKDWR